MDQNDEAQADDGRTSCCFDEWAAHSARRARSKETVTGFTAPFMDAIAACGLEGRTVLDVGCGVGDLMLGLLARGARRGTGVDLGPGAVRYARELAASRGLADRATFVVGDGADVPLEPADIVVLNRVLCCYPNVGALIANTTGAARAVFAFTVPLDTGIAGLLNRFLLWSANHWYRLRHKKYRGFRVHLHDLAAVDRKVGAAGFERIRAERVRLSWRLAVFEKAAVEGPARA